MTKRHLKAIKRIHQAKQAAAIILMLSKAVYQGTPTLSVQGIKACQKETKA